MQKETSPIAHDKCFTDDEGINSSSWDTLYVNERFFQIKSDIILICVFLSQRPAFGKLFYCVEKGKSSVSIPADFLLH